MGVDGVGSVGTAGAQQTAAAGFQAKSALQNGEFKLPTELTDVMNKAVDIYGKEMGPKYTQPAIADAEKAITQWIKDHPTADQAALEGAIEKAMKDSITKQQGRKIGDDFFMKQIISKISAALKFNTDTWEG